jgi:hypothetical protein
MCETLVDLGAIDTPSYVLGTLEDHIVPGRSAYQTAQRFVLGASGHIAGVINPASANKRSYWIGGERCLFHSLFATIDQQEGMDVFLAKRKPAFMHRGTAGQRHPCLLAHC